MFNSALVLFLSLVLTGCATMSEKKNLIYSKNEFKVDVSVYISDTKSDRSLIIVPPTGGTNYIDRSYAEEFQRKGFDVYILNHWTGDSESRIDLDIHQALYTRSQAAIGIVLENIKTRYVGLMGTSLGALQAAVAASIHDRLNSVFLITGGAPIPEVIVTSDQKAMVELKKKRFEKFGFKSDDDYLAALSKEFKLDPLNLGEKFKSKTLGMVVGEEDATVPTKTQRQLQKFWNPKTTIVYKNSHFWTILKTWLFESQAVFRFFEEDSKAIISPGN